MQRRTAEVRGRVKASTWEHRCIRRSFITNLAIQDITFLLPGRHERCIKGLAQFWEPRSVGSCTPYASCYHTLAPLGGIFPRMTRGRCSLISLLALRPRPVYTGPVQHTFDPINNHVPNIGKNAIFRVDGNLKFTTKHFVLYKAKY